MSTHASVTTPCSERPLVSLILLTYRQSSFVKAAVEGVLAQTYSPLEIIISDDASPDDTFEKIQEAVAGYQGPHRIVLNQNPVNMGIGPHVHHVASLAKGQWLVLSAGDDINLPDRVAHQMKAAEEYPTAYAIGGEWLVIDGQGKLGDSIKIPIAPGFYTSREIRQREGRGFFGCVMTYRRELWDLFPPVEKGIIAEDNVFCMRAALLGGIYMLPLPLIYYRSHGDNAAGLVNPSTYKLPEEDPYARQFEQDITALGEKGILSAAKTKEYIDDVYRYRRFYYHRLSNTSSGLKKLIRSVRYLHLWKDRNLIASMMKNAASKGIRKLLGR